MSALRGANSFLFGLTLTEIMVLFVFLLALLIGVSAKENEAQADDLYALRAKAASEEEWQIEVLAALDRPGPVRAAPTRLALERRVIDLDARLDALTRDRAAMSVELDGVRSLLGVDSNEDRRAALTLLVGWLAADPPDTGSLPEKAEAGAESAQARLERLLDAANSPDAVPELAPTDEEDCPAQLAELDSRHDELGSTNESLADALAASTARADSCSARVAFVVERHAREAGRGASYPPCWVSADGKSEYLFEITMQPRGYRMSAAWGPERSGDADALSGAIALAGTTLPAARFIAATAPIFAQSEADSCRHYVRVRDEVGNDKALYKQRLERIEQHFYKLLLKSG